MEEEVVEEFKKTKKEWEESNTKTQEAIKSIQEFGKSSSSSLPRLNGVAQDGLSFLNSLHFKLDLLATQLPSPHQVEEAQSLALSWKNQIQGLRLSLRNANLQAKAKMRKAAQQERELLLGGGEESTKRRRNLQTKAGMTVAAESITDSLRRTRQLMVQGYTHSGLSLLLLGCIYVVSKRVGLLKLQRTVTAAIKAGMAGQADIALGPGDGMNVARVCEDAVPALEDVVLEMPMHEL